MKTTNLATLNKALRRGEVVINVMITGTLTKHLGKRGVVKAVYEGDATNPYRGWRLSLEDGSTPVLMPSSLRILTMKGNLDDLFP